MSININYTKKKPNETHGNIVIFSNENFKVDSYTKYLSTTEIQYIKDLLKTYDVKKNLFIFEANSKKKIVLISIKKNLKTFEIENLGAEFYQRVNYGKNSEYTIISDSVQSKNENFLGFFLHGLKLKSYKFKKYKSKKDDQD